MQQSAGKHVGMRQEERADRIAHDDNHAVGEWRLKRLKPGMSPPEHSAVFLGTFGCLREFSLECLNCLQSSGLLLSLAG